MLDKKQGDMTMAGSQVEELRRRNAEMMTLFRGSLVISASLSQEEVQENILDLLEELYEPSLSFIMLYDGERDVLEMTACRGEKGRFPSKIAPQKDGGIVGWVFSTKQTFLGSPSARNLEIADDLASDERVELEDELSAMAVESVLYVPLIAKGNVIGVIGLWLRREENMSRLEDMGRLLAAFAAQAAIAIENTRLYEELEDANDQITEWNEFLQQRVEETTEKLVAARERLWHAERLSTVGQLVAGLVHEINNPLYAISNYAQQLIKLESDSKKLKYLESIAGGVNAIKAITENLSELTRLSSLSRDLNDINELLEDTIALVEFDAQEQGVSIKKELADHLPSIECDAVKLRQVFLNLLINALDAMPDGGTVTVRTQESPDYVFIKFADTGVGIDEEDLPHIFKPFFSTKGDDGIGLGLFVSASIIQAHDGTLTFESEKGTGSCLEIKLPFGS